MTYFWIGKYAMDASVIKMLGNPITTDENTKWVIGFNDQKEIGFCKITVTSNRNKISSIVVLEGKKKTFKDMVKFALAKVNQALPTMSYANAQTLPWFLELGFVMQKEGKEWHTVEKKI